MNTNQSECSKFKSWMINSEGEFGEVVPEELEQHLFECEDCRQEQEEMAATLSLLGSAGPIDPPRHFFVYDEAGEASGWRSWFSTLWSPQTLAVASSLLLVIMIGVVASGLTVRTDGASLTLGFGTLPVLAKPEIDRDPELLRADFRRLLVEELSARDTRILKSIQEEISTLEASWKRNEDEKVNTLLASVDQRLDQQLMERDEILSDNLREVAFEIYRSLSAQQRRDLQQLNARLELVEERDQIQGTRTDVLVDAVLQLAQRQ